MMQNDMQQAEAPGLMEAGNEKMKRLDWIDVVKGLAIFLVVLGHFSYAKNGAGAKHAIYAFHMSLFFVMAGCTAAISFAKTPSVSTFLRKKVVGVFVPYAVWCFLYRVPFTDISQLPAHYSFSEHLHCFVQGSVMVWFLICLFVLQGIYAVYKLVTRKFSGVVAKFATAGGLFILLFAMHRMWGKTSGEASCWALEFLTNAYKYYPAFAVGVLVIEYPVLFKKLFQNRFALFGYVLVFLFGIMIDKVSGYCGQVILGVGISLLIINLFVGIDYSKVQGWVLQGGVKQLKMYGKYTMAIYLFHNIFLPSVSLPADVWGVGIVPFIVMCGVAVVVCYICVALDHIVSLSSLWGMLLLGKTRPAPSGK